MKTLMKYDLILLKRTSKFIVFPAIGIFFAILSPVTAKYMPEILEALLGAEGINLGLPEVTVSDSYLQYIGNLFDIFLFVTIFVGVSLFMKQKNKGELPLVLSKPIKRSNYLISKLSAFSILIISSLVASGIVFSLYTYYLFGTVDIMLVLNITLIYFVYTIFILSVSMFMAMFMKSYAGANIMTFVVYIVFSILGAFSKGVLDYLPGRVTQRSVELIRSSTEMNTMLPFTLVLVSLSTILILVSILKFKKYDI